jgi:hypothetical protein
MALPEDLVEEVLLRVPPDEPAHLIRAALVCKAWSCILSDGGFRRRNCRFHRTPPLLLGYIRNDDCEAGPQFVPATRTPPPLDVSLSYTALDCRHGRVLIDDGNTNSQRGLIVWDPITGHRQHLSLPAFPRQKLRSFTGAVLCARRGCDHLDCRHGGGDGPFLVVFVGTHDPGAERVRYTWASVYSSETGAWSTQTSCANKNHYNVMSWEAPGSLLIGDALYFTLVWIELKMLKFDLGGEHVLSSIDTPLVSLRHAAAAPVDIDGGLGVVEICYGNCIYTWSRQSDPNNGVVGGWVRNNVVELERLIPTRRFSRYRNHPDDVIRFMEGTDTVLFSLNNYIDRGVFTLNLKSRQIMKVAESWDYDILPYTSFYTPGTHYCTFILAFHILLTSSYYTSMIFIAVI